MKVINQLNEYSTVHFHGMRQNGTPFSDGAVGITQCPIKNSADKNIMEYVFKPQSSGTFWYHGHYDFQTSDGLIGAFIVDDAKENQIFTAAGAPYMNDDNGNIMMVADYFNNHAKSYLSWYLSPASQGDEPIPDSYVVNNHFSGGSYQMTANRNDNTARIRVVNAGSFSMFDIFIDGLSLKVIELDGVTVEPYVVSSVVLNVAQRVSFIVDFTELQAYPALKDSPSIWIHFNGMSDMFAQYDENDPNHGLYGTASGKP